MNPTPHENAASQAGLDRRSFFRTALAGAGGMALPGLLHGAEEGKAGATSAERFAEPGRELPLGNDADVIVCGAGPAGEGERRRAKG